MRQSRIISSIHVLTHSHTHPFVQMHKYCVTFFYFIFFHSLFLTSIPASIHLNESHKNRETTEKWEIGNVCNVSDERCDWNKAINSFFQRKNREKTQWIINCNECALQWQVRFDARTKCVSFSSFIYDLVKTLNTVIIISLFFFVSILNLDCFCLILNEFIFIDHFLQFWIIIALCALCRCTHHSGQNHFRVWLISISLHLTNVAPANRKLKNKKIKKQSKILSARAG